MTKKWRQTETIRRGFSIPSNQTEDSLESVLHVAGPDQRGNRFKDLSKLECSEIINVISGFRRSIYKHGSGRVLGEEGRTEC